MGSLCVVISLCCFFFSCRCNKKGIKEEFFSVFMIAIVRGRKKKGNKTYIQFDSIQSLIILLTHNTAPTIESRVRFTNKTTVEMDDDDEEIMFLCAFFHESRSLYYFFCYAIIKHGYNNAWGCTVMPSYRKIKTSHNKRLFFYLLYTR